ncbi:MAG: hypothetical protein WDO72_09680 [Pseudomonadota bacterium]
MNRPDDEFEAFLTRRKPLFRGIEDPLEPPGELDRLVLRQAREALEGTRPQRVYKGPRWGAPLAIAATLVLALAVILNVGMPVKPAPTPEVTVQTVAQRLDYPAAPAATLPEAQAPNNSAPDRANTEAALPAESADGAADTAGNSIVIELSPSAAPAPASPGGFVSEAEANRYARVPQSPAFRGDSKRWLAEIERLRATGMNAQADAEYAEYKRQHRAYAVSPDR